MTEDNKIFVAVGKNIFCREIKQENKVGELYIPDSINTDFVKAEIITCSEGYFSDGRFVPSQFKSGDVILFPKVSGIKVTLNGEECIRVFQEDVVAVEKVGEIIKEKDEMEEKNVG